MINRRIYWLIALAISYGSITSCSKDMTQEIAELNLDRALSPTGVLAQVVNRTSVRLQWNKMHNADHYVVEIFDNPSFTGEAAMRLDDVQYTQLPLTVPGLNGETAYTVRIQAIGSTAPSKWSMATFTTDTEQILQTIDPDKVTSSSVVLNWPATVMATSIVITPGNIERPVSAEEVRAGEALIAGLQSNVTYTARLVNGNRTRGTITFTTLLGDNVTMVDPSQNLASIIASAKDGDILALQPGTYAIDNDLTVDKSITIQGLRTADRPILRGVAFKLSKSVGFTLKDLVLDGTGGSGNQTIVYTDDATYEAFVMEGCDVKNYVKGLYHINKKTRIRSTTFKNNLIHEIECNGGDLIDYRTGLSDVFIFEDNTVYNSALARDIFRMDAGGSTEFPQVKSLITITNNTFYNLANGSKRLLYIRLTNHEISFTKNIIANSQCIYTNNNSLQVKEFSRNNYFNTPNITGTMPVTESGATTLDPQFAAPASGNFTVNNLDLKLNGIGASRWRQ
ncbi:DUF4957 domain-containing protein [Sphingobacterium paludis]|uniref:Uncharacterized protein DUF5123 n=1 Tax=Sphingobacterium paludis TaxID=1476465 RepID=A0A4R7CXY9_9SPHI|nr:DUF4957 domain-containing protein [Sphingobacterium paludis]TDS10964.1 uncharacterized protein DUF5123 [Sphingobacterium paludis]